MTEPILLAILFADRIIIENNNKKGIIGTFDKFISQSFPVTFPPWGIYVSLTNIKGKHSFAITLVHLETNKIVIPINGELESISPEQTIELTFNLAGVVFTSPGRYNLSVEVGGELLGSRVLYVETSNLQPNS
jgi:hypothetical protein